MDSSRLEEVRVKQFVNVKVNLEVTNEVLDNIKPGIINIDVYHDVMEPVDIVARRNSYMQILSQCKDGLYRYQRKYHI